ncbi:MAG: phosphatidate cytidylyltransferase [Pseudobdellovibrionaceae bacterium]
MTDATNTWWSPIFQQTALIVLSFIFISGLVVYLFRTKNHYFTTSWASIKSWLIAAPLFFLAFGSPEPWPLVILTLIALLGAKVFLQLVGMYHRSYFVWIVYFGIIALAYCIHAQRVDLYNLMPMIVLGALCLVPLIRNNYKRMLQYISLALICFVFLGWAFMHLGLIMQFPSGIYQFMYLIILTEFCDNTNLALSRHLGSGVIFDGINQKRTYVSTVVAIALTILLAYAMRHLLPDSAERYWHVAGLVAALAGLIGDLVLTVIRRDLGIRIMGPFIIGRGDFLSRVDRLIFVAPIYYYVMTKVVQHLEPFASRMGL